MFNHTIIVFYSQIDKEKYILEHDEKYLEFIKGYINNNKIDIALHTLSDRDNTINTIIETNPYFTNAKMLVSFEQLKNKIDEVITSNAPSVFDMLLVTK